MGMMLANASSFYFREDGGGGRGDETATSTTISTTTPTMTRNRETMMSSAREESRRSHHPRKRKLVTTNKNLLPSAAHRGLLLGAGCVVCVAVAMHAASIRSGFDLLLSGIVRWSRAIMRTAVLALVGSTCDSVQVQRRQARDVTSEWSRYAHHPGARGRAFLWLAAQVLPLCLMSRIPGAFDEERRRDLRKRSGRIFATGLLKLGPTYVKIGQIASCRDGLLPREWVGELERLQDQVPARHGRDALELAYAAWPGGPVEFHRMFSECDSAPLAAASLGQVHKGRLKATGEPVAIKLQRPHLKEIYEQDMALMSSSSGRVAELDRNLSGRAGHPRARDRLPRRGAAHGSLLRRLWPRQAWRHRRRNPRPTPRTVHYCPTRHRGSGPRSCTSTCRRKGSW
jgi:ABC1 atypical kinase-like domain